MLHHVIPASIHIYENVSRDDPDQLQTEIDAACTCGLTYHITGHSLTEAVGWLEAAVVAHLDGARRASEAVRGWPILRESA